MLLLKLIEFFGTATGKLVCYGSGLALVFGGFLAFKSSEQRKGAEKLATKIEANNAAVTSKAATAARKSTDDTAPGVRNPRYRAD